MAPGSFWDFGWLGFGGGDSPSATPDPYSDVSNMDYGSISGGDPYYSPSDSYTPDLGGSYDVSGFPSLSPTTSTPDPSSWYSNPAIVNGALNAGVAGISQLLKPGAPATLGTAEELALRQKYTLEQMAMKQQYELAMLAAKGGGGGRGGGGSRGPVIPPKPEMTVNAMMNAAQGTRQGGDQAAQAFDRLAARLSAAALFRRGG